MGNTRDFDAVTIFRNEAVFLNLEMGRFRLYKGYQGEFGLPVENYLNLYAVVDEEIVAQVFGPEDLSQIVVGISSIKEAEAFCDLFTSKATHFLFPAYRDTIRLVISEENERADVGTISNEMAKKIGLLPESAGETDGSYAVSRNIVINSRNAMLVVKRTTEILERNGDYRLDSKEYVDSISKSDVLFPEYE